MTHSQVEEVARGLATWVEDLLVDLERLESSLSPRLVSDFAGDPPHEVRAKTRRALGKDVADFLEEHPGLDGAGLIFQLSQLKPETARIEWWVRDEEKINRRDFILDPDSDRFYDYEYLEWFKGAFHAGTRTVAVPYIDHLGVDDYLLTMAVPCSVDGVKVGVAGIDILMNDVEAELLRIPTRLRVCSAQSPQSGSRRQLSAAEHRSANRSNASGVFSNSDRRRQCRPQSPLPGTLAQLSQHHSRQPRT